MHQVFDIPFNSANKWSLAVTSCPGDSNHQLVMMKGAPEIVLTKCSHHLHNNQEKEIDDVRGCWLLIFLSDQQWFGNRRISNNIIVFEAPPTMPYRRGNAEDL